jgi:predicted Zn-dependent protease
MIGLLVLLITGTLVYAIGIPPRPAAKAPVAKKAEALTGWPQWMGPFRNWSSAEASGQWPPKKKWEQSVGESDSSPILIGGKVYVTAGLMKLMTNERQLAAVLGHETGHVAAQHNVQGLVENVGASVLIELAGYAAGEPNAAKAEAVAKVIAGVTTLKYSRNKEYEADLLGVRYMTKAGYNPYGMVELLQALLEASGGEEGGRLGEMLATHPLTGSRIEKAEGVIKQDHPAADRNAADPAADRFKQMKRRL